MKRKKQCGKQLLSLALAGQMLCAPWAQAGLTLSQEEKLPPVLQEVEGGASPAPTLTPEPSQTVPAPEETTDVATPLPSEEPDSQPGETSAPSPAPSALPEVSPTPSPDPSAPPEVSPAPSPDPSAPPEEGGLPSPTPAPLPADPPEEGAQPLPEDGALLAAERQEEPLIQWVEAVYGYHPYASPINGTQKYSPWAVERADASWLNETFNESIYGTQTLGDVLLGTPEWSKMKAMLRAVRVPDREFTGAWYYYTGAEKNPGDIYDLGANTKQVDWDSLLRDLPPEYIREEQWGYYVETYLTLVGRWALSGNASALSTVVDAADNKEKRTALYAVGRDGTEQNNPLPLYSEEIGSLSNSELEAKTPVSFSPEQPEYYLRVPADVSQVRVDMLAAEPFLFWQDQAPAQHGVTATVSFDGQETASYTFAHTVLNQAEADTAGEYTPVNSETTPAASLWTTDGSEASPYIQLSPSAGVGAYYNDVAVTITAPDGTTKKTYTFHIQRLTEPRLEQNPGNTPVGLIQRDTQLDEATKAEYRKEFEAEKESYQIPGNLPDQGTSYFAGPFYGKFPFDRDVSALVVYLNDTFLDPGATAYNSVGDPVEGNTGLTASLAVATVSELTTKYILEGDVSTAAPATIQPENGVWSVGRNVLPQTYSMEYTYLDPITGNSYSSDSQFVGGGDHSQTFSRSVTVLPLPGDVDLDGSVTPADGFALEGILGALTEPSTGEEPPIRKLFRYRVCDVKDKNGLCGPLDVEALYGGFVPSWQGNTFDLFYPPLPGGTVRTPASETGNASAAGRLTLDFLGKGNVPADTAVPSGEQELAQGDGFWVGANISGWTGPDRFSGIRSVTVTLTYDSEYLTPALWTGSGWIPAEEQTAWEDMIRGSQSWPAEMNLTHGKWGCPYGKYDTKAQTTIPNTGNLKELKVTFATRGSAVDIQNGQYLLRVPFLLVKQPTTETLQGLDLSLGSGDFAAVLAEVNQSEASTKAGAWEMAGRLPQAYNFAETLFVDRSRETSATTLHLSPDGVDYELLGTISYGEEVSIERSFGQQEIADAAKLPPGMTYDRLNGIISGTPSDTGTFRFVIGGKPYKIEVEPAPLTLTPEDQAKYYGEQNPALTFTYDVSQIKEIDRPGGVNHQAGFLLNGQGDELIYLSGHEQEGTLTTKTDSAGGEVGETTPAGRYTIELSGWKNRHYAFVFKDSSSVTTEVDDGCGQAVLEVKKRPVVVQAVTANPIQTVRVDTTQMVFTGKEATSGKGADGGFEAARPGDGTYAGLPLTGEPILNGESLTIRYTAAFRRDDNASGDPFVLAAPQETREMALSDIVLAETAGSENYMLVQPYPTAGTGLVVARDVAKLEFISPYPDNGLSSVDYSYGDRVSFANLTVRLTYEAGENETAKTMDVRFEDAATFAGYGLHTALLPTPESDPRVDGFSFADGTMIDCEKHDGTYFCVWMETGLGETRKVVKAVAKAPIKATQRLITITPNQGSCFYGEDPNSEFTRNSIGFTYDTDALTNEDLAAAGVERKNLKGTGEELAAILEVAGGGYTAPTFSVCHGVPGSATSEQVAAGAGAFDKYFAILQGAEAANYSFQYTQYDDSATRSDYGTRYFSILPRPIVVDQVTMSTTTDNSRYFLYDDTRSNRMETLYHGDGATQRPVAAGVQAGAEEADSFTAVLPQVMVGDKHVPGYYPAGGAQNPTLLTAGSLTGTALFPGDRVELNYVATYQSNDQTTNGNPHFQLPDGQAEGRYDVSISDLSLTEDSRKNYVLVYTSIDTATVNGGRPEQGAPAGTGRVILRPIQSMTIAKDPAVTDYTYGQTLGLEGMTLSLTFATEGDNTPDHPAQKDVEYRRVVQAGAADTDTFAQLGFQLRWACDDSEKDYGPLQKAAHGDYPTVAEHNGRWLVVYGRRHESHGQVLTAETAKAITVKKKPLTLTVTGQERYYGEENGTYAFTLPTSQLARPDQEKLAGKTQATGTADGLGTAAVSGDLSSLTDGLDSKYFQGFQGPVFHTGAGRTTNVGTYELGLSGGSMDNYSLNYKAASITVHKRPISISAINTGADTPIYNIYWNQPEVDYNTSISSDGTPGFTADRPNQTLPYGWTGPAVVAGDRLNVELALRFPDVHSRPPIGSTETVPCEVKVTNVALTGGGDNENYVLLNDRNEWTATGQLDNRNITAVEVMATPRDKYLYGQSLDLSGLKVKLTYAGTGVAEQTVTAERDGRIRMYYSDQPNVSDVAGLRPARSGDHLSISKKVYSHQNNYLILQVRQPTGDMLAPVPVPGCQIKITPLDLTYTLAADGKKYDGTTEANGTITLTNVYGGDEVSASGTFQFLDPNVKYRDGDYTDKPDAAYWTNFRQDPVRGAENWDEAREAAPMPVLVSDIVLTGGDAANYTIALTQEALDHKAVGASDPGRGPVLESGKIGLLDNRNDPRRTAVPFAQVDRAERDGLTLRPQLSVDDHTNVIRVDYEETSAVEQAVTTSANKNGAADAYSAETHLEYVLELAGDTTQVWAGNDGTHTYQDGRFFGGEAVTPKAPVPMDGAAEGGYLPDREDFPTEEELAEEDFVFQGQRYRWAEEDDGFRKNPSAYPGGPDYVRPGYDLYTTDRKALPRASAVWAGVRVAGTHNYLPSEFLYSVEGDDIDRRAENAKPVADQVTRARVEELQRYGEEKKWPSEDYEYQPGTHAAVNTYTQRLDLTSAEEKESAAAAQNTKGGKYRVYTLEAVWFTDLMDYPKQDYMDAVTDNDDPNRYRGYYWDEDLSAELDFEGREAGASLNLCDPLTVTVKVKTDGGEQEQTITVNENNTASVFVDTRSGGGGVYETAIAIVPSSVIACLGDEPVRLEVRFTPAYTTIQTVLWSSSDPSVASIDRVKGILTFHDVGVCTITARSYNGCTATATVVVLPEGQRPAGGVTGNFRLDLPEAYLHLYTDGRFAPGEGMTRGELASLLAQFCLPPEGELSPVSGLADIAGKPYEQAVLLLAHKGVVEGTGERFEGDRPATRAEFAAMLARMLCLELPTKESGFHAFADTRPQDTWAWAYIDAIAEARLTYGTGEGIFAPDRAITRGEIAVFLDRVIRRPAPAGELVLPADVSDGHWAYSSIIKGLNTVPAVAEGTKQN